MNALEFFAQFGFPHGRPKSKRMMKSYMQSIRRKTPFKNDNPGEDWMVYFERRHSEQFKRCKPEIRIMAKLWHQLNPMHAINAFAGAELLSANKKVVMHRIVDTLPEHLQRSPELIRSRAFNRRRYTAQAPSMLHSKRHQSSYLRCYKPGTATEEADPETGPGEDG